MIIWTPRKYQNKPIKKIKQKCGVPIFRYIFETPKISLVIQKRELDL